MCSAQSFIPQAAGGAQSSTDELIGQLRGLGHEVCLLSGLSGQGWIALRHRVAMKLTGQLAPRDRVLGYDTYRAWFPDQAMAEVVRRVRPQVAVLPTWHAVPMAQPLQALGVPVVMYLRDVEFDELGGELTGLSGVHYIANSHFTAQAYRRRYGIEATVVPPMFRAERYRVKTSRRFVTFINPHRNKGVDIALALAARCPDIAFRFVEGWTLAPGEKAALMSRVAECGNITWTARTRDMGGIYADARILLVPSRWEEAWGRVVSEAHFSGIPVLASRQGGLAESVGPGGVLLDIGEPIDAWTAALRLMHDDAEIYATLSRAALDFAARPALDPRLQALSVLAVLQEAAQSREAAYA